MEQTNTTTPLIASSLTELQFNTLVAHSHDGIALLNANGLFSYVSPSVERISGYAPAELLGNVKDDFIHPGDAPEYARQIEQLKATPGQTIQLTYRFKHKNGQWNWAEAIATNSINVEGINAIVFNFKNITERVETQQKALAENANRDALLNAIHDIIWSIDTNRCLIHANTAFYSHVMAITGSQIKPGDNIACKHVNEATAQLWEPFYTQAFNGNAFVEHLNFLPTPDGTHEVAFSPIYQGNIITGVACYAKNIAERKIADERLRISEKNMAIAQRIARVGSWDIELSNGNPFTQPAIWTDETYRILGYDETTQPSLQAFVDRLHPDDKDYVLNALSTGIANNNTTPIEYRIVQPNGTIRWLKTEGEIFYNTTGQATRIVGTHKDITKRKLLELEREKVVDDLTLRNKELEQFTYIVSHNLRGHVSNIIGMAAELAEPNTQPDIQQLFSTEIKNSAQKLDTVIKDLSFILQHKRGAIEAKVYISFAALVNDINDSLGSLITGQNVQIDTHFEVEGINGIKSYLYSIFHNLITNSIKYYNPATPPHITIKSSLIDGMVKLHFTDNGIGIDLTHNADKIFGLYRRFHTHTEGKGMGLYMVKNQVEQLGGTITVTSAVNQGTQFTILLPNS
jgi:PAS domain S-box-containing protein